jgi:hypothetical protein
MSYIPKNAMPHATIDALEEDDPAPGNGHRSVFRWLSDTARENPKKAMGAGALVLAGAALAASVPFISPAKPKRKAAAKRAAKSSSTRSRASGGSADARSGGATDGSKPKARAKTGKASAKPKTAASAKRRTSRARRPSSETASAPAS